MVLTSGTPVSLEPPRVYSVRWVKGHSVTKHRPTPSLLCSQSVPGILVL